MFINSARLWKSKRRFGSQSSVEGINTPDRSEKAGENGGKEEFMEFVHKIWWNKLDKIKKIYDFKDLKKGLVCSKNEEKAMIRIKRFWGSNTELRSNS